MEINSTLAARAYAAAKPEEQAPQNGATRVAKDFFRTVEEGEATAMAALSGGADSQALVEALAQTELAVETAVTVRDRVVEAYQEIMRMPV